MDTLKYWFSVIGKPAFKAAVPISKLRDRLTELLISILVALITVVVYGQTNPASGIGINATGFLYLLVATFLLRLLTGIVYLPAQVYKKQGGFIENPFEISCDPADRNFDLSDEKWVWLTIKNRSRISNVEDCILELSDIVDLQTNQRIECPSLYLTWSGREVNDKQKANEPTTLRFGSERWCDVARTIKAQHRAAYTTSFAFGSKQTNIIPGKYRLTIKAHGKWKDHPISYLYMVDLSFQPEDNLRIERVEEIK